LIKNTYTVRKYTGHRGKELEEVRLDDQSSKNIRQKNTSTKTMAANTMLGPPSTEKTALEKDFFKKNVFCHCQMHRHPAHGFYYMESQELET